MHWPRHATALLPLVLLVLAGSEETGHAGPPRRTGPGKPVTPSAATMSPDASQVVSQQGWTMRVWDRYTGKLITRFENTYSRFRGAIAAGVLVGIRDQKPAVWRGPHFKRQVNLTALPKVTTFGRVYVSPDGGLLGVIYPKEGDARDPNSFGIWDTRRGEPRGIVSWPEGCRVLGLALGRGNLVAAIGDEPHKRAMLRLYKVESDSGKASLKQLLSWDGPSEKASYSVAISGDGKRLALGAGERIFLWDLCRPDRPSLGSVPTQGARQLFPRELQVPSVRLPGAHQLAFSPDGKKLAVMHGFAVTGVAIWQLQGGGKEPLKPVGWLKRPPLGQGGTFRQIAWDPSGKLWLITATYSPIVFLHLARGDHFTLERELPP